MTMRSQMDCCLCCCGPFDPPSEILRRDPLGSRAILYMDGEARSHATEWNITDEPKLLDEKQELHIFHRSSFMPVIDFYTCGNIGNDLWLNSDTLNICRLPAAARPVAQ